MPNKGPKITDQKQTDAQFPLSRDSQASKELNESGANRSTRATTIQAPDTSTQ